MRKSVILAGAMNEAGYLAEIFDKKGYRVTIVHPDRDECEKMAKLQQAEICCGNPARNSVLEEAGIESADLVCALMHNDADNCLICQLAKKNYGVSKTAALLHDPRKVDFFKAMGVDWVVSAMLSLGEMIE